MRASRRPWALLLPALLVAGMVVAQVAQPETALPEPSMHPNFPLLDSAGRNVLASGAAVSTMQTCGSCHDAAYIQEHSAHSRLSPAEIAGPGMVPVSGGSKGDLDRAISFFSSGAATDSSLNAMSRSLAVRHVGGGSRSAANLPNEWAWLDGRVSEMNCFLCHTATPNLTAREEAIGRGDYAWSATATLAGSGLVMRSGNGWEWDHSGFNAEGEVQPQTLRLQQPDNANCGACHGAVHEDLNTPFELDNLHAQSTTALSGEVFAAQRMSQSGINLFEKDSLNRSWDIHAERAVSCVDCHYSVNNPIYYQESSESQPRHLRFDPRRQAISEYLFRPSHVLARGGAANVDSLVGATAEMRRCETCHRAEDTHDWLPYKGRHLAAVSCESCHIPKLYAPAAQSYDWTLLQTSGEPYVSYRGVDGPVDTTTTLFSGYEPVLLARRDARGNAKLSPYNLITSTFWAESDAEAPISRSVLESAFLQNGRYHPAVVQALDTDADGTVSGEEASLRTPEAIAALQNRLTAAGAREPRIRSTVQAVGIHHGVTNGEWVTSTCSTCHSKDSKLASALPLARNLPADVQPVFLSDDELQAGGKISRGVDGTVLFTPSTSAAGLYVLGHDRVRWVDWFGLAAMGLVLLGITVHGGMRVASARRNRVDHAAQTRPVYMYGFYERLWHWVQAFTIIALLFTGLGIHTPVIILGAGYGIVVWIHNILGFLLVANALLAAFYHFASGEVRQYLPQPRGFFSKAIDQALFYMRGMFTGAPHPFEKNPEEKLNPLQQITYLAILNILLPLQILTGILIWGAQRWPALAADLGGLGFLAPVHAMVAWLLGAFLLMHVYLTTTGRTPTAHLKSMVVGWEDVEVHAVDQASSR